MRRGAHAAPELSQRIFSAACSVSPVRGTLRGASRGTTADSRSATEAMVAIDGLGVVTAGRDASVWPGALKAHEEQSAVAVTSIVLGVGRRWQDAVHDALLV